MQIRCKCVCNNKQRWNNDKCQCKCKELIDKGVCDKGFNWNPSDCECECDKSYDVGIQIMKIVNAKKDWQINQYNVLKILMK